MNCWTLLQIRQRLVYNVWWYHEEHWRKCRFFFWYSTWRLVVMTDTSPECHICGESIDVAKSKLQLKPESCSHFMCDGCIEDLILTDPNDEENPNYPCPFCAISETCGTAEPSEVNNDTIKYATSNLVRLTSPTWRFFGVNEAPKTIVVNGNHLEFCQYFSIFHKTRYLIHLTTCNKHILTTSDQNRNLIAHIMDSFDSFFHLF